MEDTISKLVWSVLLLTKLFKHNNNNCMGGGAVCIIRNCVVWFAFYAFKWAVRKDYYCFDPQMIKLYYKLLRQES